MQCELCGKTVASGKKVRVEGVDFSVCDNCVKYGTVQREEKPQFIRKKDVYVELVVGDARHLLKTAREARGMRQIDLAKMLQIKDSLIHNLETGHIPLDIPLAKRFEEALHITLVKKFKE